MGKMELIGFCSNQSVSIAKLTTALGLDRKTRVTKKESTTAHESGALDFLNGIVDIGLTRRNSQVTPCGYQTGNAVYCQKTIGPNEFGTVSVGGRGKILGPADNGKSTQVLVQWDGYGQKYNSNPSEISKSKR